MAQRGRTSSNEGRGDARRGGGGGRGRGKGESRQSHINLNRRHCNLTVGRAGLWRRIHFLPWSSRFLINLTPRARARAPRLAFARGPKRRAVETIAETGAGSARRAREKCKLVRKTLSKRTGKNSFETNGRLRDVSERRIHHFGFAQRETYINAWNMWAAAVRVYTPTVYPVRCK